jgi:hypothetical protein
VTAAVDRLAVPGSQVAVAVLPPPVTTVAPAAKLAGVPEAPQQRETTVQRAAVAPSPGPTPGAEPRTTTTTPVPTLAPATPQAVIQRLAESAPPRPSELPLPPVQRTVAQRETHEATGRIARVETTEETSEQPVDIDRLADRVWKKLKRDLRVERERERGMP